jgi:pimeloyl-ACP methyl ester carboxylesterase
MEDLTEFCAPGTNVEHRWISVSQSISLRLISFHPKNQNTNPAVVFVAGWISQIAAWREVLREMTRYFPVYYMETREKISSRTNGIVGYGIQEIGDDITSVLSYLQLEDNDYILFGSSLGATAILDCASHLPSRALCLILVAPNAEFRVPRFGMGIVRLFYPPLYNFIKPYVKWYLKTFRLDIKSDYMQYQKYCNALDAADPWKLKKAILSVSRYKVWNILDKIDAPTLIVGASKDKLHEAENIQQMVSLIKDAAYVDLETNKRNHSALVVEEMRRYVGMLLNGGK